MSKKKYSESEILALQKAKRDFLMSWAVDYANSSHRYLPEYEKSYYEYHYLTELKKRATDFRNYDELRWFILYNVKKLTDDHTWFNLSELREIIAFYVDYYKDDQYYKALKEGESFLYMR